MKFTMSVSRVSRSMLTLPVKGQSKSFLPISLKRMGFRMEVTNMTKLVYGTAW